MIKKITINAGKKILEDKLRLENIEAHHVMDVVEILRRCEQPYCIIINIIENDAFCEHIKLISKVNKVMRSLTPRETEVLRLAIDGLSNIDISEKLCISRETVKSHRKNILSKVGVSKVNDLKHMLFKTTAVQEIIF